MSEPKIRIKGLVKWFESHESEGLCAIDGVDLDIQDREFVCILGPSGCGKSTMLNIISQTEPPTAGEVVLAGGKHMRLAFVFQMPCLLPWRTAADNIKFGLEARGKKDGTWEKRMRSVIELVGLTGFEKSFPHQLSGGMQTRAAIARALVTEPDILLMDEPFSNLDEITARRMRDELLDIWQKKKMTIVFVTHDLNEAVYLGDRVVICTPRPAKIYSDEVVDVPRPRSYADDRLFEIQKIILQKFEEMLRRRPHAQQADSPTHITST